MMLDQKQFNQWLNENFQLIQIDENLQMLKLPIFPLNQEALTIYIEKINNEYIISDRGSTFETIYIIYGKKEEEMNENQINFINTIIEDTEIVYERNKEFRLIVKNKELLMNYCFEFITNLIPIYYSLLF